MNRREFSSLLPLLAAASALAPLRRARRRRPPAHDAARATCLRPLSTDRAHEPAPFAAHVEAFSDGHAARQHSLEAHFTHLAPGCPPEPIGTHKHTEIWFIHEGTARLMTAGVTRDLVAGDMGVCVAGDQHTIYNASQTEPASYFVLPSARRSKTQASRIRDQSASKNSALMKAAPCRRRATRRLPPTRSIFIESW